MSTEQPLVLLALALAMGPSTALAEPADVVRYEAFGAVGDNVHDDLPAICRAHEHANARGLPVQSDPGATYHLGSRALTAVIATDTDWSTSRFTIDDSSEVENHKQALFEVRSLLPPATLKLERLVRDQKRLEVRPEQECYVAVRNDRIKRFIRRGLNQNAGTSQRDCFILHRDGSIEGAIDWDYDHISHVDALPIDPKQLVLRGGVFTTIANQMKQEIGYNYWGRHIVISRSNTEVRGLRHDVVGETSVGHPYSGFISVHACANVTLRDCVATAHRTYRTIGAAGKPVSMGSYDYSAGSVVNFTMINCRMDDINDRSRWGVIGSNFCKNILLEDCVLNRMDAHMGVSGSYIIRGCTLGYAGLNAIGRGHLLVEDSTLYGGSLLNLRSDYGSTWEGEVVIRNCRWIPSAGSTTTPYVISLRNDGQHDFGYDCFMPREVTIDGLHVDDSNHPEDYQGLFLFSDPGFRQESECPFPYVLSQRVVIHGLTTASGKTPRISPNARVADKVILVWEGESSAGKSP
jgi:hypothetical protein